jgi:general secretion pathway protein E
MLFRAHDGGCTVCTNTGYKGRTAIYELLLIDEKIRQLTIKNADAQSVKNYATSAGMRTLREDGAQKVLAGMTTTAEVLMITTQDVD